MVPKLTAEQRRAALDKGMQIRLKRAEYILMALPVTRNRDGDPDLYRIGNREGGNCE